MEEFVGYHAVQERGEEESNGYGRRLWALYKMLCMQAWSWHTSAVQTQVPFQTQRGLLEPSCGAALSCTVVNSN